MIYAVPPVREGTGQFLASPVLGRHSTNSLAVTPERRCQTWMRFVALSACSITPRRGRTLKEHETQQ